VVTQFEETQNNPSVKAMLTLNVGNITGNSPPKIAVFVTATFWIVFPPTASDIHMK
jgi:hypothetical protein